MRLDVDLKEKINKVNECIHQICMSQGYAFIDNKNINSTAVNKSKFHLNTKGMAHLAVNFIRFIRDNDKRQ